MTSDQERSAPAQQPVHALEATAERLFPESKHRSKRIREKHWYTRFFDADVRRMEAEREVRRIKADMAELRRICTARIEELEATSIPLTKAEIQSGHNRVRWAECLIRQLPTGHNGRDSWLLNFGTKEGDGQ